MYYFTEYYFLDFFFYTYYVAALNIWMIRFTVDFSKMSIIFQKGSNQKFEVVHNNESCDTGNAEFDPCPGDR